jgi:hypothetical protein
MPLDSVLKFVVQNQALICAVFALTISELLPFVKSTQWNGILQGLLKMLKDRAAAKKAALLLPLAFLATLPGCAFCKDAANAAVPRCVLEANMIKCGESSGFALMPIVLSLIANAIAGQPFDAKALEAELVSEGVKDVPCVLAALEDYLAGSALAKSGDPASMLLTQEIHAALLDSLAKKGLHGHLTLKLRAGHQVDVELP